MPDLRPRASSLIRKELARLRARGPAEVLTLAKARIRENLWSDKALLFFARAPGGTLTTPQGLLFRRAAPADGSRYERDIGTDSASTFGQRLSGGTRCYLVQRNDALVHASWVTTYAAWTREVRRYFGPPRAHAYVYESFTREDARGLGIYPFALKSICAVLAEEGMERVWVGVEAHNEASIKAVTKGGFQEAFRISYRRRFGVLSIERFEGPELEVGRTMFVRRPIFRPR